MKKLCAAVFLLTAVAFPQAVPRRSRPGMADQPVQPVSPQPEYTGPRGSLSGTVTDSVSGAPVRKAQVNASALGIAVTDASGSFRFEQVPPGAYFVHAMHPNYPQGMQRVAVPKQITLGPGEEQRGLELKLTPGTNVGGRITDDDGDPMAGCNVTFFTRNGRTAAILGNANTGRGGEYTFANLPANRGYLEARCPATVLQPRAFAPPGEMEGPQLGYHPQFYPGTPDFNAAQKLVLVPGQDLRGMDFHMTAQKVSSVAVTISGMQGENAGRLSVTLLPNDGSPARPNSARTAMLRPRSTVARVESVPPGNYTVVVQMMGPEQARLARVPIEVGEQPKELTVPVSPPVALSGLVHMPLPSNTNGPGAAPPANMGRIWLTPMEELFTQAQAEVKPDGTFTLRSLGPGKYRVNVPAGFVESITLSGATTEGPEFELTAGATGPLEVNVSFATGQVSGDVQMGETRPNQIFIFAACGTGGQPGEPTVVGAVTAQAAHYSAAVRPGRCQLYAMDQAAMQTTMPVFLSGNEKLSALGESVDVRAGGEVVRNLKLITAADLEKLDQ